MLSNLSASPVVPVLIIALAIGVSVYLGRLLRLSRQVWQDYGIQLRPVQAIALLRHQVLQIVGGRQLRYDVRAGRVILS